jgi:hypothetical protein
MDKTLTTDEAGGQQQVKMAEGVIKILCKAYGLPLNYNKDMAWRDALVTLFGSGDFKNYSAQRDEAQHSIARKLGSDWMRLFAVDLVRQEFLADPVCRQLVEAATIVHCEELSDLAAKLRRKDREAKALN